jgi:TatD DNase family protein
MGIKTPIPMGLGPFIETHCHLDYLKTHPLPELLDLAQKHGVEKIVTIAVSPQNLQTVIDLAQTHSMVYCTQGIHPHQAKECNKEVLETIERNLSHPKVVAVGEIGLDYHYNHSPRDQQIQVFREHLLMAAAHDKPVVIHSRDADEDMQAILKEFAPVLKRKGVIHSFSSSLSLAKVALECDFYLGFNGIITFRNADLVREAVALAPIERILFETDAPFLTPMPYRGQENGPQYLPFIAQQVAQIKQLSLESLIEQVGRNSRQFFSLS